MLTSINYPPKSVDDVSFVDGMARYIRGYSDNAEVIAALGGATGVALEDICFGNVGATDPDQDLVESIAVKLAEEIDNHHFSTALNRYVSLDFKGVIA